MHKMYDDAQHPQNSTTLRNPTLRKTILLFVFNFTLAYHTLNESSFILFGKNIIQAHILGTNKVFKVM